MGGRPAKTTVWPFGGTNNVVAGQLLQQLGQKRPWNLQRFGNFFYPHTLAIFTLVGNVKHGANGVLTRFGKHKLKIKSEKSVRKILNKSETTLLDIWLGGHQLPRALARG